MNLQRSTMFLAAFAALGVWGFGQALADSAPSSDPPHPGCLSGVVIDSGGNPLAAAMVQAWVVSGSFEGIVPNTKTAEDGTFRLCDLAPGLYTVVATKDEEYYADPRLTFYSDGNPLPETELEAGDEVPDLVVQVGPKVARVKGKIMDAATGKPVINDTKDPHHLGPIMVYFYEASGDHNYMDLELDSSAEFSALVPTKPFRLFVPRRDTRRGTTAPTGLKNTPCQSYYLQQQRKNSQSP
ncbi:MAG TPA: carboxypeptidase-like regulatory domain-containing protein [Terriglobia bacterium]|nr:carboxypeptidase-like regulatory domain-containing protein [Terriglobia bacterium]